MPAPPEISVVIPAYNAHATIDLCLSAVLAQSLSRERYEVIVVDDGSTDDTATRAESFGVRVMRQANAGPAAARNNGAREARGALLVFTDSDCEPTPTFLEALTRPFSDPAVQAAKGSYKTKQTSRTARFAQLEFEERYDMLDGHPSIDMIDTYAAVFRTQTFRDLGGFDPAFPMANNEDTDLSYRLAATGALMIFVREAIVYHQHPNSLRRYMRVKYWRGFWRMVVYKRYREKMFKDTYTPQTLKLQSALVALAAAGVPVGLVRPVWGGALIALGLGGVLVSSLPFVARSWKRDPGTALLSPLFLLARAASIGSGALMGTLSSRS